VNFIMNETIHCNEIKQKCLYLICTMLPLFYKIGIIYQWSVDSGMVIYAVSEGESEAAAEGFI
jgi:hypothetical protein